MWCLLLPTCLLSSLQLHNAFCQPKEYFSSVSKPKDKVSFCFLRVWPVIGVLCIKFILLLSSAWVLNWVGFFFDPHKRGINKLGLSLLKCNISLMHFSWESEGEGSLFSLMEVVSKSNAFVVKQRIYDGQMDEIVISRLGSTFLGSTLGSQIILSSSC